jgi:glycosyltransferase involved in cell wall biosynthesis
LDATIVICTLDRPERLKRALNSCLAQERSGGITFDVVVVDNSADGNVGDLVGSYAGGSITVRYVHEPRTNISHARNAGVAAATGRYLAFVDDDMEAPPDWIGEAIACMERTAADILIGSVVPEFETSGSWADGLAAPAEWFGRDIPVEDGDVLHNLKGTGTGNSVFRRERVFTMESPFDPAHGRLGGEDTDFLQRAQEVGAKIVFSKRAWMKEIVPANRSSAEYLARRRFRESQQFVRLVVKNKAQVKWLTASRHMAAGAVQLGLATLRWAGSKMTGADPGLPRVAMAQALGKVLWTRHRETAQPYR